MSAASIIDRLRRDLTAATCIPYTAQLAPQVIATRDGDYVQAWHLTGASFDAADPDTLNNWHERLNVLWRNIASPQVALWTHLVRRRDTRYPAGEFPRGFAQNLNARYRARLSGQTLMVNDLYLTLVYRPHATGAEALTAKLLRSRRPELTASATADALDACAKLRQLVSSSLVRYDAEALALPIDTGRPRAQLLEFFGELVNGEAQRFDLPRAPIHDVLATTRLLFGREAIEYRTPNHTRFGAMLGIKEYPTPTTPGMFNALLAAPYPLILTQSYAFLSRAAGQGLLQRQFHRLSNAGDFAVSQAEELKTALDQLASNHFAFGEHHLSLQVLSDPSPASDPTASRKQLAQLNDRLAHARSVLADTGMVIAREDLGLEAAFWAQLPGNFALRPRRAAITTRNFSALAPLHNYPSGRATGNHWGEALTLFKTAAGSPYYFSLHASDPSEPDGGSRRDTGHTFLCGPTGSGKTVLIGFLIAMLAKHNATQVIFDKDRGLEILVRAQGGTYQPLINGEPTGFNPLQLPATATHRDFLRHWLLSLLGPRPLTAREHADLTQALSGTLALDPAARRLSRLIEFLDPTDAEGLYARLAPWCEVTHGERAWAFDNANDAVASRFGATTLIGFDVTAFLDNATIRTPVTLYLFHLVRQLLDGRRLVCWLDEFWRMIDDPAFASFAKDGPKTWRKLNAVMCLSTQSPSDVLASPLSRTIIEQTPTKILFPNPDATPSDYRDGLNLSARETQLIREGIEPGSRRFLVKQARQSVVCELDLKGFDAELAVISGRAESVALANRLIAECGSDPKYWLARFIEAFVTKSHVDETPDSRE
jgi:type IV secretion system protein VirB4